MIPQPVSLRISKKVRQIFFGSPDCIDGRNVPVAAKGFVSHTGSEPVVAEPAFFVDDVYVLGGRVGDHFLLRL
jgi:hypothetical protein